MLSQRQVLNNRYRIVTLLGRGGFGDVYRAWDIRLNYSCAVKENSDTSPNAAQQFNLEATILANLHHPNLPRVTDSFSLPGQGQYLVMDYIEGEDLQAKLDSRGPLPPAEVLAWCDQVCDALMYMHAQPRPVIHRDIKPANIRITPTGKAMLVDFGIAKLYDPTGKTVPGARAVTPGFSPPEQYGNGRTGAHSDVYALGATLYAVLSGHVPTESVQRLAGTALPFARNVNPLVPPALDGVIARAMELDPNRRFSTIAEMQLALARSLLPQTTPVPPPPPPDWRRWLAVGLAAVGLLALILFFSHPGPPPSPTPVATLVPSIAPIPSAVPPTPTPLPPTATSTSIPPTPTDTALPPTPTDTAIPPTFTPRPAVSQLFEDPNVYASSLQLPYTKNTSQAGNILEVHLNTSTHTHAIVMLFNIVGTPPNDYVMIERCFVPEQDWSGERLLEIWIENDSTPRNLVVEFGEGRRCAGEAFTGEVWRGVEYIPQDQNGPQQVPFNAFALADGSPQVNGRIDLDHIGYFAVRLQGAGKVSGSFSVGRIWVRP